MADLTNIRDSVPSDIQKLLLDGEEVYFYARGGGCLGGAKSYVAVTDSRVLGVSQTGGRMSSQSGVLDIPLQHISSVKVTASGCLWSKTGMVTVHSGTATERFPVKNPADAQAAANTIQAAMRKQRGS